MKVEGKEIISRAHNIKRNMHTPLTYLGSVYRLKVSIIQVKCKVICTFFQTLQIDLKGSKSIIGLQSYEYFSDIKQIISKKCWVKLTNDDITFYTLCINNYRWLVYISHIS